MKKSKIIIFSLLLIAIFISISGTYAYYIDSAETKAKLEIANWIIKVNSSDITLEENHTFEVKDLLYNKGNKVSASANKFAPGMLLDFTVAIDATESMVALEYYLDIDISNFNNPNVVIKDVISDNGSLNYDIDSKKYYGKVSKENVEDKTILVTVTLEWLDNTEHQEEDNALGAVALNHIKVPVSVEVNQYTGGW